MGLKIQKLPCCIQGCVYTKDVVQGGVYNVLIKVLYNVMFDVMYYKLLLKVMYRL